MTTSNGHFNVSQKTATALGLDVISILPHVVSVRTDKGPRFVSRKRFDEFERRSLPPRSQLLQREANQSQRLGGDGHLYEVRSSDRFTF